MSENIPLRYECDSSDAYESKLREVRAENKQLRKALDLIGLLGSSDKAYTSDFTTQVMGIVRRVMNHD